MLKRLKVEAPPSHTFSGDTKGKSRAATVEDAPDEDMEQDTSFAPGGDPDYFAEEDEDGRFYGGGLSSTQKEIMVCASVYSR
jgi:beta-catenin-like protein 1